MEPEAEDSPFDIDPSRLDKELLKQPRMSRAAGRAEAEARHALGQANARLDVVKARLYLAVRNNPANFQLRDKPTVDEVEAAVKVNGVYEKAVQDVTEAQFAVDVAKADSVATLDRRKVLENLVELLALDFHAEREPRAHSAAGRDRADELRRAGRRSD